MRHLKILFIALLSTSCLGTRYLKDNESIIYKSAEIEGVKNEVRSELEDLVAQKPNKKLLGFLPLAHLAYAYKFGEKRFDPTKYDRKIEKIQSKYDQKIQKTTRDKKINRLVNKKNEKIDGLKTTKEEGNWWMKVGEPLALFDQQKTLYSVNQLRTYLQSHGYFDAVVDHETVFHTEQKVSMKYRITPGKPYVIDSIYLDIADSALIELLEENNQDSKIQTGQVYDQKDLEDERNNIYQTLSNNGYFNFSRQFVSFEIDTFSLDNKQIFLTQKISNPSTGFHQKFTVDSIAFFSGNEGSNSGQTIKYNGVSYNFGDNRYRQDILGDRIFIEQNTPYSRYNTIQTQQQLSFLDAFRFVNINYDSLDDHRLVANIFTSPLDRYQTNLEVGAITASQQIPGPFVNIGIKKRNAFNGLETFDITGNFSLQGISNVGEETSQYSYTLFQYGVTSGISFPRFLFPTSSRFKRKIGSYNPQTRFQVGYNYEDRTTEYERQRAEFSFSYLWRLSDKAQYNFTPITFSFIDVRELDNAFNDFLTEQENNGNGALRAAFNSSVISSTSFETLINLRQPVPGGDRSFLRLFVEMGGNLVNLLGEDFLLWQEQAQSASFSFFRWAKFNLDYRRVHDIDEKSNLAYRFNLGVSYPYGDDPSLPYEKRFYIGGSNSVRAWQVRRLGPGSFNQIDSAFLSQPVDLINYQFEQGGDMILEASLEYRRNLVGFVDYALFLDAGNIWLVNSNFNQTDADGDDGFFRFDSFLSEIAIGAGVGIRLDFSFFVFRLDGAIQVHDPAQRMGNRWVIDDVPLGRLRNLSDFDRQVLRNKTNITLGIGLPF